MVTTAILILPVVSARALLNLGQREPVFSSLQGSSDVAGGPALTPVGTRPTTLGPRVLTRVDPPAEERSRGTETSVRSQPVRVAGATLSGRRLRCRNEPAGGPMARVAARGGDNTGGGGAAAAPLALRAAGGGRGSEAAGRKGPPGRPLRPAPPGCARGSTSSPGPSPSDRGVDAVHQPGLEPGHGRRVPPRDPPRSSPWKVPDGGQAVRFPAYTAAAAGASGGPVATADDPAVRTLLDRDFRVRCHVPSWTPSRRAASGQRRQPGAAWQLPSDPGQFKIQLDHGVPPAASRVTGARCSSRRPGPSSPRPGPGVSCARVGCRGQPQRSRRTTTRGMPRRVVARDRPVRHPRPSGPSHCPSAERSAPRAFPVASADQFNGAVDDVSCGSTHRCRLTRTAGR